jgi:hypothetical protein
VSPAIRLTGRAEFCSGVDPISKERREMPTYGLLAEELSQIISQAIALAFLLGAMAVSMAVRIRV